MIIPVRVFAGPKLPAVRRQIDQASAVTPALIRAIMEATCGPATEDKTGRTTAIWRLARAEAYVDAALSLIGTVLPDWSVRRICYEDGQWWCAMNPRRPVYWDADEVDEAHPVLALAVFKAFVTALHRVRSARQPREPQIGTRETGSLSYFRSP
jgi:hypothetical protein